MLVDHLKPFPVAKLPVCGQQGVGAVFAQPFRHVEVKVLLTPQHSCQSLAHDAGPVCIESGGRNIPVEFVSLLATRLKNLNKLAAKQLSHYRLIAEPEPNSCPATRIHW